MSISSRTYITLTMVLVFILSLSFYGEVSAEETRGPGYFSSELELTAIDFDDDSYKETVKVEITITNSNWLYTSTCDFEATLSWDSNNTVDQYSTSFQLSAGHYTTVTYYLSTESNSEEGQYTVYVSLEATDSAETNYDYDSGNVNLYPAGYIDKG